MKNKDYNDLFVEDNLPNPLEKEELYMYLEKVREGDLKAREEVITHNIKLVISIVQNRFNNTPYEGKELVSVGITGLTKAVDTFKIENGTKFATYASTCIINEILMYIRKNKKYLEDNSFDAPISVDKDGSELKLEDTLIDETVNIESNYEKKEILLEIRKQVELLDDKEKEIVKLYFGFYNNKRYTQEEIAEKLGVTRSWIQRIIRGVTNHIGSNMLKQGLIDNVSLKKTPYKVKTSKKKETNITKKETIFDLYQEFSEEQVLEVIDTLNDINKAIIELKYGINGKKETKVKDIAQQLNIETSAVSSKLQMTKKQISKKLEKMNKSHQEVKYVQNDNNITKVNEIEDYTLDEMPSYISPQTETKTQYGIYGYGRTRFPKKLSTDEQNEYLKLAYEGDYNAQQKLFEHNLGLVANIIAKRFFDADYDKEELFQIGCLGLWKAIQNFDISFNVMFSTYAVPMIIGEIRRFLRDNDIIHITRSTKDLIYQIFKLQEEHNNKLSIKQLSEKLEVTEEEIKYALNASLPISRLEEPSFTNKDGNDITLGEAIPDLGISVEEQAEDNEMKYQLRKLINKLDSREKQIIEFLYGLNGPRITQMKVAEKLGISQAQVSRIEKIATKKLKYLILNSTIDDSYIESNQISEEDYINDDYIEINNTVIKKSTIKQQNIFKLFPRYNKKQVLAAIEELDSIDKDIIELRYGLNGNESVTIKNLEDAFEIEKQEVKERINEIIKKIKINIMSSSPIFELFPGYSKEDVLAAIKTLSTESKKIIELRYGLNGEEIRKTSEIAQIFNVKTKVMHTRICRIKTQLAKKLENGITPTTSHRKKSKKIKYKSIFELYPEYTKEQILGTISTLSEEKQKIIKLRYELDDNEVTETKDIAQQFDLTVEQLYNKLSSIQSQIKRRLEKGITEKENIFELYPEYTKEQVLGAISTLNEENKTIIELKYGLNDNKVVETSEIAKQLGLTVKKICSRLGAIHIQIKGRLEKGITQKETIFDLYPEYTEKKVLDAISRLNVKNQKILELAYGLNDNKQLEPKQIAQSLNVTTTYISHQLDSIKTQIKRRLENEKLKDNDIFKYFSEYSPEQILLAISMLRSENRNIIELKYGLNGKEKTSDKEIKKILSLNSNRINARIYSIKLSIEKKLKQNKAQNLCNINSDIKEHEEKIENKEENIMKKGTIFDLYPEYTEEQILGAIEALNEENKKIIKLKYGLDGNTAIETKEIAQQYNTETATMSRKICMIKKQIAQKLEKGITKKETIFDLYPEYTEKQVLEAIDTLNDVNKEIIELKYGMNGKEVAKVKDIAQQLNIEPTAVSSKLCMIKKQITNKLEKLDKSVKEEISVQNYNNIAESSKLEVITFDDVPSISYQDKIKEIENLILTNKYSNQNTSYEVAGGVTLQIKTQQAECLFAHRDGRINSLNRALGTKKDCYVYCVIATGPKKEKLYEKFLIKDIKTGNFYNFVYRYTNGEYDLSNVRDKELVCYDMGHIHAEQLKSKEIESTKEKPKTKIIPIHDEIDYKPILEEGIQLFKDRQIVNSEPKFLEALKSNQKFVLQKANYYLGKVYLAKKKAPIAEKYLRKSLRLHENNYLTMLEMGKTLTMQKRYDEAIQYFDKCDIVSKPDNYTHTIEKARCYKQQGNIEGALKIYDFIISKKPDIYTVYYEKALILFETQQFEATKKQIQMCEILKPNNIRHITLLGKIKYLEGNIKEGKELFNQVVEIECEKNSIYNIVNIAYFFHKRGEKDLAHEYYQKSPRIKEWFNISDETVQEHINAHTKVTKGLTMHSIFNCPISLDVLNLLIKDMEKTTTKEIYDVYQIHCDGVGYMIIDDDNKIDENYITILTLPFTKKIMNSYPDNKMEGVEVNKSIELEYLFDYAKSFKTEKEALQRVGELQEPEVETLNFEEYIKEEPVEEIVESNEQTVEDKTEPQNFIEKEEVKEAKTIKAEEHPIIKETIKETDTILLKNQLEIPMNLDFEQHKEQIKMLINMLNNPTEQVVLLLRLGFVKDRYYTEQEIAEFLHIEEYEVSSIINKSLSNIIGLSTLAIQRVETVRQQIDMTKNKRKELV